MSFSSVLYLQIATFLFVILLGSAVGFSINGRFSTIVTVQTILLAVVVILYEAIYGFVC